MFWKYYGEWIEPNNCEGQGEVVIKGRDGLAFPEVVMVMMEASDEFSV